MLLAVDIGNTNITLGLFDDEILLFTARLATDKKCTADEYAIHIKDVLEIHGSDYRCIEDAIICSVVPAASKSVSAAISTLCNIIPLELGPGIKTGINIKIDNPAQLGADLAAGAAGALAEYTMPCIIIDMGTATTLSVLDENGTFIGGAIAAGVNLTLQALTANTSALPDVSIESPRKPIGTNTADCMRSGLVLGTAAMLDGLIDRFENQLGQTATVIATGGLSKEIIEHCSRNIIYNENLLLEGLRLIYEKNN